MERNVPMASGGGLVILFDRKSYLDCINCQSKYSLKYPNIQELAWRKLPRVLKVSKIVPSPFKGSDPEWIRPFSHPFLCINYLFSTPSPGSQANGSCADLEWENCAVA